MTYIFCNSLVRSCFVSCLPTMAFLNLSRSLSGIRSLDTSSTGFPTLRVELGTFRVLPKVSGLGAKGMREGAFLVDLEIWTSKFPQ